MRPYSITVKDLETAKDNAVWGTYGKEGDQPLTWKRLIDCDTDHLQAILRTMAHLSPDYIEVIGSILKDRGETPERYDPKAAFEFAQKFFEKQIKLD